uniref:Uncharacterized protein n=1 Tax=Strongyloides stercoralis TaxID=6248 RepID=A0A0K0DWE6_STRER
MMIKIIILIIFFINYTLCIRCGVGTIVKYERLQIPNISQNIISKACEKGVKSCINGTLYYKEYKFKILKYDCDYKNECSLFNNNVCMPISFNNKSDGDICCCSFIENCNARN